MQKFNIFELLSLALLVVGGLNWGLIGAFDINLVSALFGEMTIISRVIYTLVGLSALYSAFTAFTVSTHASSSNRVAHS